MSRISLSVVLVVLSLILSCVSTNVLAQTETWAMPNAGQTVNGQANPTSISANGVSSTGSIRVPGTAQDILTLTVVPTSSGTFTSVNGPLFTGTNVGSDLSGNGLYVPSGTPVLNLDFGSLHLSSLRVTVVDTDDSLSYTVNGVTTVVAPAPTNTVASTTAGCTLTSATVTAFGSGIGSAGSACPTCTSTTSGDCLFYVSFLVAPGSTFNSLTISGAHAFAFAATQAVGTIAGDPQFVGLRGQSYQVHGIDGAVYNLISDSDMQLNARFAFLREGRCPTLRQTGGEVAPLSNCFSHPGSYIGELAIQQVIGSQLIQAVAKSGPADVGFSVVTVNNEEIAAGHTFQSGQFLVNRTGSHTLVINTPLFNFQFDSSDRFINQRFKVNVPLANLNTHGLIGQTNKRVSNPGSLKYIEGEVDDYVVLSEDLLGNDFVFNQFNPPSAH